MLSFIVVVFCNNIYSSEVYESCSGGGDGDGNEVWIWRGWWWRLLLVVVVFLMVMVKVLSGDGGVKFTVVAFSNNIMVVVRVVVVRVVVVRVVVVYFICLTPYQLILDYLMMEFDSFLNNRLQSELYVLANLWLQNIEICDCQLCWLTWKQKKISIRKKHEHIGSFLVSYYCCKQIVLFVTI